MFGLAIVLLIAGVASYGFYDKFVAPTTVLAARVGDQVYTQGDLVTRIRVLQADAAAGGEQFAAGRAPFQVLQEMYEAGVIRRSAPSFDIQVLDAEVEAVLMVRFGPRVLEGEEVDNQQMDREFREAYNGFLNSRHISDEDYKELIGERIYRARIRQALGEQLPKLADHVELHWILLPTQADAAQLGPGAPIPEVVRARLDNEEFAAVASEVSVDRVFSDFGGYVGWAPRGAFPQLDAFLFGAEEQEPIPLNLITPPILARDGTYILKVTGGPEQREVNDLMFEKLKDENLDQWLAEQLNVGGAAGWFELKWNSDLYAWVIDQVGLTARRTTPEPESPVLP